jgi:hypothetical protein
MFLFFPSFAYRIASAGTKAQRLSKPLSEANCQGYWAGLLVALNSDKW